MTYKELYDKIKSSLPEKTFWTLVVSTTNYCNGGSEFHWRYWDNNIDFKSPTPEGILAVLETTVLNKQPTEELMADV